MPISGYLRCWQIPTLLRLPTDSCPGGDVKGVVGQEAYLNRLQSLEASLSEGEPLVTWGYHRYFHGDLDRKALDKISKKRPIVVWQRSVHELIFNTAALDKFNITRESWSGEGESYEMLDWDKGHAWEKGLYLAIPALFQLIATPEKFADGILRTHQYLQAGGITTVVDPGMMLPVYMARSMVEILESDDAMMDYLMIPAGNTIFDQNGKDPEKALAVASQMISDPAMNGKHVRWLPKQIKLFSDGAAFSQLMKMKDGYLDGHEGEWIQYPKDLETSMRPFWQNNYTIVVHANGDYGLEVAVEVWGTVFDGKVIPVQQPSKGLVMNEQSESHLAGLLGFDHRHGHQSDMCEASQLYQQAFYQM